MIVIRKAGSSEDSTYNINRTTGQLEETLISGVIDSGDFEVSTSTGQLSHGNNPDLRNVVFGIDADGFLTTYTSARFISNNLVYSGTFMDIPFITTTIKTHAPIDWSIGDFIIWDYDGLTYTLKDLPQVYKQATTDSYGEAYVYEGVKFQSKLVDVKYVEFLDIVLFDNNTHFTSLPQVSFTGNVSNLIDRINANLGRLYANWTVIAADVSEGEVYDAFQEKKLVETNNISCWDAIGLFYSLWGLGFTYYYDALTSKHTIMVGATGGVTGNFSYGQGNGLYIVGKSISKEDGITTRLRAYGSTRNMPARYYNNKMILGDRLLIDNPLLSLPNLMIPYDKWAIIGDPNTAYINCNNPDVDIADTSYAQYGIREKSIFFDGNNNSKEIYPTIENITAGEMRHEILNYNGEQIYISPSLTYGDNERLDTIKIGDQLTDDGTIKSDLIYEVTANYAGSNGNEAMTTEVITKRFEPIYTAVLDNDGEYKITFTEQKLTVTGVNTLITDGVLRIWIQRNGNRALLSKSLAGVDVIGGLQFTLPELTLTAQELGDVYSIELEMEITIPTLAEGDIATIHWVLDAGTAKYTLTKIVPITTFSISLKQIGFDIFRFLPSAGQIPIISMTSGACEARQFRINRADYLPSTDSWELFCTRQADDSIGQLFPNINYRIKPEDSFVLLNLNMPEIFISIAETRLYVEACKWLKKAKENQYIYEPKVDEVYMAINPQLIKEGMIMPVVDTDLGIDDSIIINSITITEVEDSVRTFDVVLRDDSETDLVKFLTIKGKEQNTRSLKTVVNAVTAVTKSAADIAVTEDKGTFELGYIAENVSNKVSVLNSNSTADQYVNAKALYDILPHYSNGVVVLPTINDNGDGSVTIGDGHYSLSSNTDGTGFINLYKINGDTFILSNLNNNYIVADYNLGTPLIKLINNDALINQTTIIPIFSIFRNGTNLHLQPFGLLGTSLSNKLHQSIIKTQRYRRETGLAIAEFGTKNISISAGRVWMGIVPIDLDAISSDIDLISFWYHSGGNWVTSQQGFYVSEYYDNGVNIADLTANRYAINWVFRGVENQKHTYIVLGRGDYTLSQAQIATVPDLPIAISSHALLVGKIIIQKGAASALSVQSPFDVQFVSASISAHNETTGLQGGAINQYYHLSAYYYNIATRAANNSQSGYLSSTDWYNFYLGYLYSQIGHLPLTGGNLSGPVVNTSTYKGSTGIFTDLTGSNIPYHENDSNGLKDSPISTDGTNVNMGNGTVTMKENINTRLRIPIYNPSAPPTGLAIGEYYLYILE